jgi:hypothetical protein
MNGDGDLLSQHSKIEVIKECPYGYSAIATGDRCAKPATKHSYEPYKETCCPEDYEKKDSTCVKAVTAQEYAPIKKDCPIGYKVNDDKCAKFGTKFEYEAYTKECSSGYKANGNKCVQSQPKRRRPNSGV